MSLEGETAIGLSVLVNENDPLGREGMLEWSAGILLTPKDRHRYGDLMLRGPDVAWGRLRGRLGWRGQGGSARRRVRIRSLNSPLWTTVATDGLGEFDVQVPPGRYAVEAVDLGREMALRPEVYVGEGSLEKVELLFPPPVGQSVEAGPGRGNWQTFGVMDGLPSRTIRDIAEDDKGNLWFATARGAAMYDGSAFAVLRPLRIP